MREEFDSNRALRHISKLSSTGRITDSPGERLARAYIVAAGEMSGVRFEEEEELCSLRLCRGFMPAALILIAAFCAGGSLSYLYNGYAALVFGSLLLAVLCVIPFGFKIVDRIGSTHGRDKAVNLVGRVESERKTGTVIVCAHYDTKSQFVPLPVRLILMLSGLISAFILSVIFIVSGALYIAGGDIQGNTAVFIVGIAAAAVLAVNVLDRPGNRSPGALDNASGVAVVLELARIIRMNPLENFDFLAVAFGAEEIGLCGSSGYVRTHKDELGKKPCFVINFDMPASRKGKVSVNTGFGFPPKRTSCKLNEYGKVVAAELGYELDEEYLMGGSSDHYQWVKEGFEATSFTSSAAYIHSSRDTVGKINREALGRVGEIALRVLRRLDDEAFLIN